MIINYSFIGSVPFSTELVNDSSSTKFIVLTPPSFSTTNDFLFEIITFNNLSPS